jgi:hypothetical protein
MGISRRDLDIDVVFDSTIHDLSVVLSLVHAEVESSASVGVRCCGARPYRQARLRFWLYCQPDGESDQPRAV